MCKNLSINSYCTLLNYEFAQDTQENKLKPLNPAILLVFKKNSSDLKNNYPCLHFCCWSFKILTNLSNPVKAWAVSSLKITKKTNLDHQIQQFH